MATKRTRAILTLGGVFLVGAICGALALGAFVRGEVRSSQRLRDRGGFHEYFAEQLELTTAQRDSLQGELDWFYGELAGLRTAAAGDLHDLLDSLDRRLATRLSPEQVERLRATETRLRRQLPAARPAAIDDGVESELQDEPSTPRLTDTVVRKGSPATPSTPKAEVPNTKAKSDTTLADTTSTDPDDVMTGLRDRLQERLHLSADQSARIREIITTTRRQIRRDVAESRGFPRMQMEIAGRRLREMDRLIVELLDDDQRTAYEPIREEMARRMRAKILKQSKKLKDGRQNREERPGSDLR
jgi:hypothetical protein